MSDTNQTTLGQDEAYELLSNARRRFVISYLRSQDGRVPLNELSQSLAAWENDIPVDELGDQQIKRIYVSLYQTHLPKLEEAGLIEYDRENSTLEIRRRPTGSTSTFRQMARRGRTGSSCTVRSQDSDCWRTSC